MLKKLLFYFALLVPVAACAQAESKSAERRSKTGLRIDNRINRGTGYTDSLGTDYNLRYIPVTITNDTTIPIRLQIAFSKEYNYPYPYTEEKFKLVPLPKEWALDGVGVTDYMISEIPNYMDKPVLNETIEPGEKFVIAIGTLYSRPTRTTGVLPNMLFVHSDSGIFPNCDWRLEEDPSSGPEIALGLKLVMGARCIIIPCGQISFSEP